MKKLKWSIMSLSVVFSICAAFATRPHFDCSNMTQYYFAGGTYNDAGREGVDYTCQAGTGTCTFYTPDGIHYYTCSTGLFDNCVGCAVKNTTKKGNPASNRPNADAAH